MQSSIQLTDSELEASGACSTSGKFGSRRNRLRKELTGGAQGHEIPISSFPEGAVLIAIGFLIAYVLILRPWHHRWGATDAEVHGTLPADNLIMATSQITHGITINTPPEKIWPWLMQIGQDRSGFYCYTPLENRFGCERPTSTPIGSPTLRGRRSGSARRRNSKMVAAVVASPKAFVMVSGPDWSALQTGNHAAGGSRASSSRSMGATPLLARLRGGTPATLASPVVGDAFWDPAHFFMERKMLKTIKKLAETQSKRF